ncbi:MAG: excinuclease ABC subunit B [Candidatus Omnitrophica bacterium 4484_49]|nr:MAG: excinuclease ABC subunit B [Candidatus Omnitrophica bacterium 4484_49]
MEFKLVSSYKPKGDQPQAIQKLIDGIHRGLQYQTLLGVTGSGKTFTIANVIAGVGKPVLVISHNKTLAAQLYREFREFFPYNAVEYFVSYYDYYQPEAYIPETDTYIEKDASINEELDKLRLRATSALMSRRDVIIVASVSCIYNLGSPQEYKELVFEVQKGMVIPRRDILRALVEMQYERNDFQLKRGTFRARGETVEVFPSYEDNAFRIVLDDEEVAKIEEFEPLTAEKKQELDKLVIFPAKHFVATGERIERALESISNELQQQLRKLRAEGKLLEAQRLEYRTRYDMEMLREAGYCHGIENYSRHISGRPPGSRPYCLLDYFPEDFLTVIDESHVTIPQLRGMYNGDRARKETLVEHGFRLPSCLDNRPLRFKEFEKLLNQVIFVSATPGPYELKKCQGRVVEQLIRPTGLLDPEIVVKPTQGQIEDLIVEIKRRMERNERVLVTTLTKRMAEDLASYLKDLDVNVHYLHSEIEPIERVKILKDLRLKKFDCIVGINLLREGLDLPEVSLVAILDADKEGFLRSQTSLIQIAGRAARNINGKVIMYADKITESMRKAIEETNRRRKIQMEYNRKHGIKPRSIQKAIRDYLEVSDSAREYVVELTGKEEEYEFHLVLSELYREMELAARNLEFEKAAKLRDIIHEIKEKGKLEGDEQIKILKAISKRKIKYDRKIKSRRD